MLILRYCLYIFFLDTGGELFLNYGNQKFYQLNFCGTFTVYFHNVPAERNQNKVNGTLSKYLIEKREMIWYCTHLKGFNPFDLM